ncbi:MAG: hypothetical protein OXT68_18120 [Chloroflexota bacterium]|nr:hypothetical protein [Chloroflexota bacterium]
MKSPANTTLAVLVFLALYLALLPAPYVSANDIKVDKQCSLAQAIGSANNDSSKARCETGYKIDTISLKEDLELEEELPDITSRIILDGNGHTIRLHRRHVAFVIKWGNLTVKDLIVKFRGGNRSGPTIEISDGSLTIKDSQFLNCTGKFDVEDSLGAVLGDSAVCNYTAETVASWFDGPASPPVLPPAQAPAEAPVAFTCETLDGNAPRVSARYGLQSGVQCRRVDATGIGDQSVLDAGYIDAFDIYGYVEQGVELCFPRLGAVVFLDAATAPRSRVSVEYFARDGMTCASLDRPGTVILVPGQAPMIESAEAEQAPAVDPAESEQAPASQTITADASQSGQCLVTTIANLKLRSIPFVDDNVIGYVPRGATLNRISGNEYWHYVQYYSQTGWINASEKYVVTSGTCD